MNIHPITNTHQHICLVYFATAKTDELILSEEEVSEDCRWFSEEELEEIDLNPLIKTYAKEALLVLKNDS